MKSIKAVLVALLITSPLFIITGVWSPHLYTIIGQSMEPNFNDGDMSLVLERSFSVARFDVIIVGPTFDEKNLIKRVIGLPGEEVVVLPDGEVFIKEPGQIYPHSIQPIQDDSGYIIARSLLILAPSGAICRQLPEGCYWVMGDNRSNSHDSRAFGPVKRDNIIGKVLFKW